MTGIHLRTHPKPSPAVSSLELKSYSAPPGPPSPLDLAPLLSLLIPLLIGYSLAARLPLSLGSTQAGAFCLGLALLGLARIGPCHPRYFFARKIGLLLGLSCLSLSYALYRNPIEAPFSLFVTKEASVQLRIERVFSGSKLYFSGLGRIFSHEAYLQDLNGKKVYFRSKKKANPLYLAKPHLFLNESRIQAKGVLRSLGKPKTDFEYFLKEERVGAILDYCRFETILQEPSRFAQWCDTTAQRLETTLSRGCETKYAPIYTAMVLGRKTSLEPKTKRLFLLSGTMHIFAISGLHIGIVAGGLWGLGKLIRMSPWAPLCLCDRRLRLATTGLGLGFVYLYVGLTGFSASAERAFLMLCLGTLASMLRRQSHLLGTVVSTATSMLLWKPSYLDQLGFQLSFAAVGGIALYGLPLARVLSRYMGTGPSPLHKRIGRWILSSLAVSLGASLACAPLCIQAFKVLAYGGVLINLLLLPLASISVLLGAVSGICGCIPLFDGLSPYLNTLATILIQCMEGWICLCLKAPYVYTLVDAVPKLSGTAGLGCILVTMLAVQARPKWSKRLLPYAFPLLSFLGLGLD